MLESVVSNPDQSRAFVAAGGIDLLLRLYSLPRLPPAFATSGGQYGLLGTFKTFTPQQGPAVSAAISSALVGRLVVANRAAQELGAVNICTLPEAQRTAYAKLLAGVDGLVGLAAAVVRTAAPMLVEVGAPRAEAGGGTLIAMLSTLLQWVAFQASAGDLFLQQQAAAQEEGEGSRTALPDVVCGVGGGACWGVGALFFVSLRVDPPTHMHIPIPMHIPNSHTQPSPNQILNARMHEEAAMQDVPMANGLAAHGDEAVHMDVEDGAAADAPGAAGGDMLWDVGCAA